MSGPRYEKSDFNVKAIGIFAAALLAVMLLTCAVAWFLLGAFRAGFARTDPAPSIFVAERALPPEPRLQEKPWLDFDKYYDTQMRRLSTFGWVDRDRNVVHVPIEQAIKDVAARGLPARADDNGFSGPAE